MPQNTVTLEDSQGKVISNPSEDQIIMAVEEIGGRTDHCILHLGGEIDFIQSAGSKNRLLVQYSRGGALYESERNDLDPGTVSKMFLAVMKGEEGWGNGLSFTAMEGMGTGSGGQAGGARETSGAGGEKTFQDQLLDSAKREVKNGIDRFMRKGIRGLFRK